MPRSKTIVGVCDAKIHPVGNVEITLKICLPNNLTRKFWVIAQHKTFGVLEIDFLRTHRLMVIPVSNEIQDMDSKTIIKLQVQPKAGKKHKSTLTVEAKAA